MELLILLKLKWDIMVPTTKDFLVELLNQLEMAKMFDPEHKDGIKTHANTFIDLITLGKHFYRISELFQAGKFEQKGHQISNMRKLNS